MRHFRLRPHSNSVIGATKLYFWKPGSTVEIKYLEMSHLLLSCRNATFWKQPREMKIVCVYKNICLIFQDCVEKSFSLAIPLWLMCQSSFCICPLCHRFLLFSLEHLLHVFLPVSGMFFVAVLHCHIQAWPIYRSIFVIFFVSLWMIDSCSTMLCLQGYI